MDHEKFKNVAAGLQSLVIAIGLIAGGIWTAWIFHQRREAQSAQLQIQELEARTRGRSSLHIELEVRQLGPPTGSTRTLEILARVSNTGSRDTGLIFRERAPLTVSRVEVRDNNVVTFSEPIEAYAYHFSADGRPSRRAAQVLFAGDTDTIAFLAKLPGRGIYLVSFLAEPTEQDLKDTWSALGVRPRSRTSWGTTRYIFVE